MAEAGKTGVSERPGMRPSESKIAVGVPLSDDEQARFGSLHWVRTGRNPDEGFGVERLKLRTDDGVSVITKNDEGQLVKDVIIRSDTEQTLLGGGSYCGK